MEATHTHTVPIAIERKEMEPLLPGIFKELMNR